MIKKRFYHLWGVFREVKIGRKDLENDTYIVKSEVLKTREFKDNIKLRKAEVPVFCRILTEEELREVLIKGIRQVRDGQTVLAEKVEEQMKKITKN